MTSRILVNRLWRDESGAQLALAAMVMPVFIVLALGAVDVIWYLWQRSIALEAAQRAARILATSTPFAKGDGLPDETGDPKPLWDAAYFGKPCRYIDPNTGAPTITCMQPGGAAGVTCNYVTSLTCTGGYAAYTGARFSKLATILGVSPNDIEINYTSNLTGFNGRPGPVGVDVRVKICKPFRSLFLQSYLAWTDATACPGYPGNTGPKITAISVLPGEDLADQIDS